MENLQGNRVIIVGSGLPIIEQIKNRFGDNITILEIGKLPDSNLDIERIRLENKIRAEIVPGISKDLENYKNIKTIDVEKILIPYNSFDYQSHTLNRIERRKKERMNKKRKNENIR